jgi:hypothetical protein
MSNFIKSSVNPETSIVEDAEFLDDYFGRHEYGVRFPSTGKVFREEEVEVPTDTEKSPPQE